VHGRPFFAVSLILACAAALTALPARGADLMVFAAASLKEALDEQVGRFESAGRDRVRVAYASSSSLARQIEHGAPADVFISADTDWMDYLAGRKLIDPKSRVNLLSNGLVLIAPAGSAVRVDIGRGFPLSRLLGTERLAIADPDYVPAGKYARAALESLGVWSSVADRTARAENVRAALALVARGEASLGIVYRSDALAEKRVRAVAGFPASSHPPIVYPAALIAAGKASLGAEFLAFLRLPSSRLAWEGHGFGTAQ
jgi:molybdate transport system substrate-binding protein